MGGLFLRADRAAGTMGNSRLRIVSGNVLRCRFACRQLLSTADIISVEMRGEVLDAADSRA